MDVAASLSHYFGFSEFRAGQEQTVRQLLNGQSSLAIFPTGSGKSLCYQLTAIHLPHLTLVVSPLLALMKDQLNFLASKGIAAASLDSSLSAEEYQQTLNQVRQGSVKILMVSVERFKNERFRHFIKTIPLSMLVVDEAHCISEWGHNFRPDYLKLPRYRDELNIPLVLLLTATATRKVKHDMAQKFAIDHNDIVQTGFYRANLALSIESVNATEKDARLVQTLQTQSGAGIVYVTLQQTAETVAAMLRTHNLVAEAYHAGFPSERRQAIQDDFMSGKTPIIVATIAFGMGIDKADIRFVIHYDLPKSIENYSQEIGRAGRDGKLAHCVTLANLDGLHTVENFVYGDTPEPYSIQSLMDIIINETQQGEWELQLTPVANQCNIRLLPFKTLLVQLELMGLIQAKYSYFAEIKYKFLVPQSAILAQFQGERQQFLQTVFAHSHFKRIWGQVDFNHLSTTYDYDRSRILTALECLKEQQLIELETKGMTEVFQVHTQSLENTADVKDLVSTLGEYFSAKANSEIARIATLMRFFALDRCLNANLARYFDDNTVPERCGHCSACAGRYAHLVRSTPPEWPSDTQIKTALEEFESQLAGQQVDTQALLTNTLKCRFLVGLAQPLFQRYKIKQLSGYGLCGALGYQAVFDKISVS